ncbi:putative sensory transduction regulator [Streptomyces sp. 840.1]|uniref:YbjN domain-containing protein n=1 Tax=Streptomyces sp. 840.1 TaxID=2485152 RepID=UPI000F488D7B|nr:YbjN domain-containing protein [Streptomyces sp. 840.1]ROQ67260.1 putative sensory transduction regulator [Streptomyces sp. 840.1]
MADAPEEAPKTQAGQADQTARAEHAAQADQVTRADQVAQVIGTALDDAGLDWESPAPGSYVVQLPGTRKLSTTCSLLVGKHSLSVNAFVIRHPDENEPAVHRWLLERNLRLFGVSYAVDSLGDVYLVGKLPLSVVTPEELDRLLGVVLEAADGAFNPLLELGFAGAIRKEYEWRVSRGESTRNLDAFTHLTQRPTG